MENREEGASLATPYIVETGSLHPDLPTFRFNSYGKGSNLWLTNTLLMARYL